MREAVIAYIKKKYKISPEYPWAKYDSNAVFRHSDNKKWFALVMEVGKDRLGLLGDGSVDVINLKIDDLMFRDMLLRERGILPAYHMNKKHWITVLLDGTVKADRVYEWIDASFLATASKKKQKKMSPPREWIIPANPKYYDVVGAFEASDLVTWKQSSDIHVGDMIYMYVAAPYSSILYKCKAVEVDIPYHFSDKNLTVKNAMKVELLEKYESGVWSFERMKQFGVYAVRGPRNMPAELKREMEKTV